MPRPTRPAGFRLLSLILLLAVAPYSFAQNGAASTPSDADLDSLVAPIALYPDALVANILAASTFPVEIVEAARATAGGAEPDQATIRQWDASVQALVAVPAVLKMMNDKLQWSTDLGQAVSQDQSAVMAAVQRVRAEAKQAGNLRSNDQQTVQAQGDTIVIIPTNPQYLYVPQYDPVAILQPAPPDAAYGMMTFGLGFAAGALTAYSCNWGDHWGGSTIVVNRNYDYVNAHGTSINSVNRSQYTSWRAPANVGRVNPDAGAVRPAYGDERGDGSDLGSQRPAPARSGNDLFDGAGGGGWQARAASNRGAQSYGGFQGGGFHGGGRR